MNRLPNSIGDSPRVFSIAPVFLLALFLSSCAVVLRNEPGSGSTSATSTTTTTVSEDSSGTDGSSGGGGGGGSGGVMDPPVDIADIADLYTAMPIMNMGSTPTSVATGDFNEDGNPDFVTVSQGTDNLYVYLAKADATGFDSPSLIATQDGPRAVTASDMNADGHLDLLVTIEGSHTVGYFKGVGDGTFNAPSYVASSGTTPFAIKTADFNGDGKMDFVVTNQGYGGGAGDKNAAVFFGNGLGAFSLSATYAAGNTPRGIAIGDFNGDSDIDFAVAAWDSFLFTIFTNDGSGVFSSTARVDSGHNNADLLAVDLNNDSKLDLVLSSFWNNRIYVYMGVGDGTFGVGTYTSTVFRPWQVSAADVNGDGKKDLIVGAYNANSSMEVKLGNGDGTWQATLYGLDYGEWSATADFNGDGVTDFVAVVQYDTLVRVFYGFGDGYFGLGVPGMEYVFASENGRNSMASGDLDGDGMDDVVSRVGSQIQVKFAQGSYNFTANVTMNVAISGNGEIKVSDMDDDGYLDILVYTYINDYIEIFWNQQNRTFTGPTTLLPGAAAISRWTTADTNGDGQREVITTDYTVGNVISVYKNLGSRTFDATTIDLTVSDVVYGFVAGDLNEDGKDDLVISIKNLNDLYRLDGTATAALAAPVSIATTCTHPSSLRIADFSGDNNLDVSAPCSSASEIRIFTGDGAGAITLASTITSVTGYHIVADPNRDGIPDIVTSAYSPTRLEIRLNDGALSFTSHVIQPGLSSISDLAVGDYDGDGKYDILLFSNSSDNILAVPGAL